MVVAALKLIGFVGVCLAIVLPARDSRTPLTP
jgi:hypothetical protein